MLQVQVLDPKGFKALRQKMMLLLKNHQDGRITKQAAIKFKELKSKDLNRSDVAIITCIDEDSRLAGMLACTGYGKDFSLMVVHKSMRGHGIAKDMLNEVVNYLGEFYGIVAVNNIPSLKAIFGSGFVAYDMIVRPSGKVVLKIRKRK